MKINLIDEKATLTLNGMYNQDVNIYRTWDSEPLDGVMIEVINKPEYPEPEEKEFTTTNLVEQLKKSNGGYDIRDIFKKPGQ